MNDSWEMLKSDCAGCQLCPLCQMLRAFGVRILDVQEAQA